MAITNELLASDTCVSNDISLLNENEIGMNIEPAIRKRMVGKNVVLAPNNAVSNFLNIIINSIYREQDSNTIFLNLRKILREDRHMIHHIEERSSHHSEFLGFHHVYSTFHFKIFPSFLLRVIH